MDRRRQYGLKAALFALLMAGLCSSALAQTASPIPASVSPTPTPDTVRQEAIARRQAERKARRQEIERFLDGKEGDAPLNRMLDRLPPGEDREAFRRNLMRWRDLPPEERQALRGQVDDRGERIKAETETALKDSGLKLNPDQREVFNLRYMQERRKLERALLDQMNGERTRRLPKIVEQLKKEFPAPPAASPSPSVVPSPTARPTPLPATPTPGPTPAVG